MQVFRTSLSLVAAFIMASLITPTGSRAQEDVFKLSFEELLDLEITSVSKIGESKLKAPATVEVITAAELRQRGYTDLEQWLHDLPGFDISRGNGTSYSNIYQRGYRSLNTDRTLLLIDGVEENDLWSGTAWLSRQYPLTNIKRIEVIYGPASTMYGANAFVGVINVITKDPDDIIKKGKNFGIISEANYGTWNTRYIDLTTAARYQKLSLTLSGRLYRSDEMDLSKFSDWDYDLSTYDLNYYKLKLHIDNDALAAQAKHLDSVTYYGALAQTGYRKPTYGNQTNDWLVYSKIKYENFTLGIQTWQINEGFGAWYRDDYEPGTKNKAHWSPTNTFFYATYEKELTRNLSVLSRTTYKSHMMDGSSRSSYFVGYLNGGLTLDSLTKAGGSVTPYWDVNYWYVLSKQFRTEVNVAYTISKQVDVVAGIEYRNSLIQGDYIVSKQPNPSETGFPRSGEGVAGGNYYEYHDVGLYAQTNYRPHKEVSLIVGGRIDHNELRNTGGYGTVFNPRLAAIYAPGTFIFKIIYAEAFKDVSTWTKYGTVQDRKLANADLPPERVKEIEGDVSWNLNRTLYLGLSAYHSYYSDVVGNVKVVMPDSSVTSQHQAIGALRIQGVQASSSWYFKNYSLYGNYTYTHPWNTKDDVRIGDIASHRINLGVNALYFKRLNINLRMNYTGERKTGKNTTVKDNPYDRINSYTIFNGAITYSPFFKGMSLQLSAQNILNRKYFDPGVRSANGDYYAARLPQNERNFMLKIIYEF